MTIYWGDPDPKSVPLRQQEATVETEAWDSLRAKFRHERRRIILLAGSVGSIAATVVTGIIMRWGDFDVSTILSIALIGVIAMLATKWLFQLPAARRLHSLASKHLVPRLVPEVRASEIWTLVQRNRVLIPRLFTEVAVMRHGGSVVLTATTYDTAGTIPPIVSP